MTPPTTDVKRILIIDDDPDFAESLSLTLQRSRTFDIQCETQSTIARKTAIEFMPHLILLDVQMEKLSGTDLYFLFQRDQVLKKIPVVILSGLVEDPSSNLGLGLLKRLPSLPKPFQLSALLEVMDAQIHKAENRRPVGRPRKKQPVKAIA